MKGVPATYLGRIVSKENFRAYIYAPDGSSHLVESWDEFEAKMQTGLWFAKKEDALNTTLSLAASVANDKPRTRARKVSTPKLKQESLENVASEVIDDMEVELVELVEQPIAEDLAFEVPNDDFLPRVESN